eukprot:g23419.t1
MDRVNRPLPTNNLSMLHFSSFHPKHIKTAIPYGQALCIHGICSDEEECDRHLNVLKDALIRTGYDAQFFDHQFRRATVKNRNDLLRRQPQKRLIGYPSSSSTSLERRSYAMFFAAFNTLSMTMSTSPRSSPTPPLLAFKKPPNLKQTTVRSKLPSLQDNIDHNSIQARHGNLCKTCQIMDMDTTITHGNTTHHVHGRYS